MGALVRKMLVVGLLFALMGFAAGCGGPGSEDEPSGDSAEQERALEEAQREVTEARQEAEEARREAEEIREQAEAGEASTQENAVSGDEVTELSPSETLGLQYELLNAGRYDEAYDLFAEQSQRLVSRELYSDFFAPTYEVSEYSVTSEQISGETATVQADLVVTGSQQGTQQYPVTQEFVLEDGEWRVVLRDEQIETFTGGQGTGQEASPESEESADPGATGDSGVIVRVTGTEAFSGNYGTLDSSRSVDGVAPAEYEVEGLDIGMFSMDSVSVVMQKTGAGAGELGVQIVVDGEVVEDSYTTAEYGVVQASWSPAE